MRCGGGRVGEVSLDLGGVTDLGWGSGGGWEVFWGLGGVVSLGWGSGGGARRCFWALVGFFLPFGLEPHGGVFHLGIPWGVVGVGHGSTDLVPFPPFPVPLPLPLLTGFGTFSGQYLANKAFFICWVIVFNGYEVPIPSVRII